MPGYTLSKTTFLYGIQCDKRLYLNKHFRHLADTTPAALKATFDRGKEVGLLAQQLFPGGVDASPPDHFRMLEAADKTRKFIEAGHTIIYEATFVYNGVLAALDILVRDEEGWKGYEVKSSGKLSQVYYTDAAIQYYVITGSGLRLTDMQLLYINRNYIRGEELDIRQLFAAQSVKSLCEKIIPIFPEEIERLKNILQADQVPEVAVGAHCTDPYTCNFAGHCGAFVPPGSNPAEETFRYPACLLQLDTTLKIVPPYPGTKPFTEIPNGYTLYGRERQGAEKTTLPYTADCSGDPRPQLIQQLLLDTAHYSTIYVHDLSAARKLLQQWQILLPRYAGELADRIPRLRATPPTPE